MRGNAAFERELKKMREWLFPVDGKKPCLSWGEWVDKPYGGVDAKSGGLPLGNRWVCLDFESLDALVRYLALLCQRSPLLQGLWVRSPKGMHIYFLAEGTETPKTYHDLELRTGRQYMVFPNRDNDTRYILWRPYQWIPLPTAWKEALTRYEQGEPPNPEHVLTVRRVIAHIYPEILEKTDPTSPAILAARPEMPLKSPLRPVKPQGGNETCEMGETGLGDENSGQNGLILKGLPRHLRRVVRANRLLAVDCLALEAELFERMAYARRYVRLYRAGGSYYQASYLSAVNLLYQYSTRHELLPVGRYTAHQLLKLLGGAYQSVLLRAETYQPRVAVRVLHLLLTTLRRQALTLDKARQLVHHQLGYRLTKRQLRYRLNQLKEWGYAQKLDKFRYGGTALIPARLPHPDEIPVVFSVGYLVAPADEELGVRGYWRTKQYFVQIKKRRLHRISCTQFPATRIYSPWRAYLDYLKKPTTTNANYLQLMIHKALENMQPAPTVEIITPNEKPTTTEKLMALPGPGKAHKKEINTNKKTGIRHSSLQSGVSDSCPPPGDLNYPEDLNYPGDLNYEDNYDFTDNYSSYTPPFILDNSSLSHGVLSRGLDGVPECLLEYRRRYSGLIEPYWEEILHWAWDSLWWRFEESDGHLYFVYSVEGLVGQMYLGVLRDGV